MSDEEDEQYSDVEEGSECETVWLDPAEFDDEELPELLNSSSSRKKTIKNIFPLLADRVYRCKEYPEGIYINEYGQVCPDDKRSGIYKRKTAEMMGENKVRKVDSESDDDEAEDEEDEEDESEDDPEDKYWEKKEKKVASLLKKRKPQKNLSEDDDYSPEEQESEESEESSGMDELDKEINESMEQADKDEDWQPQRSRKKRRIIVSDDEDDEDEDKSKTSEKDEDDEEDEDDDEDEEFEEEEKHREEKSPMVNLKNLTKEQKRELYLQELKDSADNLSRLHDMEERKKHDRIRVQKIIRYLEEFTEAWKDLRTQKQKEYKKAEIIKAKSAGIEKPKIKNMTIRMMYDSHLLAVESGCDFTFKKTGVKQSVSAKLDCQNCRIVCQCQLCFSDVDQLYNHLENQHFLNHNDAMASIST